MENILQVWLYFTLKQTSKNGKHFSKNILLQNKQSISYLIMKCPSVLIVEEIEPFLCFVQEEMEAKIKHVDTIFCLLSTCKISKFSKYIIWSWECGNMKKIII